LVIQLFWKSGPVLRDGTSFLTRRVASVSAGSANERTHPADVNQAVRVRSQMHAGLRMRGHVTVVLDAVVTTR